ncbi:MAG: NADPH-dependent 7-cyano-7-deazaguanine reductase QueF [Luminiphilus sp.]
MRLTSSELVDGCAPNAMEGVLGRRVSAPLAYAPDVLERIERIRPFPFVGHGWDVWHCYELSWFVGDSIEHWIGALSIPADSPATVESKSLKLYLNSLNHHQYDTHAAARHTIERDVGACVSAPVSLACFPVDDVATITLELSGVNLPTCTKNQELAIIDPAVLTISPGKGNLVSEHLISHSLRSLCPVTAQPDWGSLSVRYSGPPIEHASLATYLDAYRTHQGFHEQCVEQIYSDLMSLGLESLQVIAFYQRRGGIDITPWRSDQAIPVNTRRIGRQ